MTVREAYCLRLEENAQKQEDEVEESTAPVYFQENWTEQKMPLGLEVPL